MNDTFKAQESVSWSHKDTTFKSDPKRLGRLLFGTIFLALFIGYLLVAQDYTEGSMDNPGPGMFPTWVGWGGIMISLIVVIESLTARPASGNIDFPRGSDLRNVLMFFGMLTGYVLLLPFLGQYVAATAFAVAFIKFVGRESWLRSLIVGPIMAIALTYFFDSVLALPLPNVAIF